MNDRYVCVRLVSIWRAISGTMVGPCSSETNSYTVTNWLVRSIDTGCTDFLQQKAAMLSDRL